jgi:hypothetical protein
MLAPSNPPENSLHGRRRGERQLGGRKSRRLGDDGRNCTRTSQRTRQCESAPIDVGLPAAERIDRPLRPWLLASISGSGAVADLWKCCWPGGAGDRAKSCGYTGGQLNNLPKMFRARSHGGGGSKEASLSNGPSQRLYLIEVLSLRSLLQGRSRPEVCAVASEEVEARTSAFPRSPKDPSQPGKVSLLSDGHGCRRGVPNRPTKRISNMSKRNGKGGEGGPRNSCAG